MSRRVTALARDGRLGEAIAAAQDVCEFVRRTLGEYHPKLADALICMARLLLRANRLKGAAQLYEEALVVQRSALGETHSAVATTLAELAELRRGRFGSLGFRCPGPGQDVLAAVEHYDAAPAGVTLKSLLHVFNGQGGGTESPRSIGVSAGSRQGRPSTMPPCPAK
jgi:hypothetical protein